MKKMIVLVLIAAILVCLPSVALATLQYERFDKDLAVAIYFVGDGIMEGWYTISPASGKETFFDVFDVTSFSEPAHIFSMKWSEKGIPATQSGNDEPEVFSFPLCENEVVIVGYAGEITYIKRTDKVECQTWTNSGSVHLQYLGKINDLTSSSAKPFSTPNPIEKPTPVPATPTPKPTATPKPSGEMSTEQTNAIRAAEKYLAYTAFSQEGLIGQLEFEKYTHESAVYAVEQIDVDWNEQAVRAAIKYLDYTAFSYTGLIKQLEFEKYTHEQAVYGADNCGADWMEQAVLCAAKYLDYTAFSKSTLISQLEFEGFTHEQAVYGAEQNGY